MPKRAIFVHDDETDELIAGVCVYSTDGPYLFLEHFAYDPTLEGREGLRAIRFLCAVVKGVGAVDGKVPLILTGQKGIASAIQKEGFQLSPARAFYAHVGVSQKAGPPADQDEEPLEDTEEETVPQRTPKRKRRRKQERPGRRKAPKGRAPLSDFEESEEDFEEEY